MKRQREPPPLLHDCTAPDFRAKVKERADESAAWLFPPIEPYSTGTFEVGVHTIYYEECGNPNGKPAVILHGGPGAGCSAKQRRVHDPAKYRIVLFDQRGCGRSTPDGCLEDNTTWHLVADIERLRILLKIEKWQVFGGSWGSTLALAYAISHPSRVMELVLRGIFLVKRSELEFIYQTATPQIYPEAYESLSTFVEPEERHNLVSAYRKRVMSKSDPALALEAARRWCEWEDAISMLYEDKPTEAWEGTGGEQRIHLHYMWNKGFFEYDGWLLDHLDGIQDIPTVVVHGRYDVVCPPASAFQLSKKLPKAKVIMAADSGHAAWEPTTTRALVEATNSFS